MTYRNLDVWRLARGISVGIHRMTIEDLPKFEMYELGSQVRRSITSVRSNIVEGYGRRRYKNEFLRFLVYALSSCDETRDHLDQLRSTGSLRNQEVYAELARDLETLGRKLNNLIGSVERGHRSVRECEAAYVVRDNSAHRDAHPASSIQHPASGFGSPDA